MLGTRLLATVALLAALPASAAAHGGSKAFNHVGSFNVPDNLNVGDPPDTATSSEIVSATPDGKTLVYTDSLSGRLGFVDISNPALPAAKGAIDAGGEPTSVAVVGKYALVAVNTSPSLVAPNGHLAVVNVQTKQIVKTIPLGGQPDSISISPDERYAAIVIENERDEDLNDGLIPQLPAGNLKVLDLKTLFLANPVVKTVDLTALAATAPSDPEAEFVDINSQNEAVVSLQENNHLAIVDLKWAKVVRHFSAGSVTIEQIDATEDDLGPQGNGVIKLEETITRRREPDAVAWVDNDSFATANEGDYVDENGDEGGSRSFTIFSEKGKVEFESGASFEHEVARAGHYPEARSENKGSEPEGVEVASYGKRKVLFVGSERANVVGVYDLNGHKPEFKQLLPTGIGPEGIKPIPNRNLVAVTAEVDGADEGFAVRPLLTVFKLEDGKPVYPYVKSVGSPPIPWVALSGLAGDQFDSDRVWAVSDSILAQAFIYRIDVDDHPALIEKRIAVGGVNVADQTLGDFDLEGIAARPEGGFWLASEGRTNAGSSRPNLLVRTDSSGNILQSVPLPPALVAGATSSGFEGVAVTGRQSAGTETVWAVIQREWADDPDGFVKIARYHVATGQWTFARYQLDPPESPASDVVGLSEIALLPGGRHVAIIERDDQLAGNARIKRLYRVDLFDPGVTWRPFGQPLDVVKKTLLADVLDDLDERSISVPDKLEGVGVTRNGRIYLATDNDGVDENYGETLFFRLGG
jgi:Esterase-like activity of phytase/LVIVD repeat